MARSDRSGADIAGPHLLAGTPGQIAEDLLGYRERYGISYRVVRDTQPFARVLPASRAADLQRPRVTGEAPATFG